MHKTALSFEYLIWFLRQSSCYLDFMTLLLHCRHEHAKRWFALPVFTQSITINLQHLMHQSLKLIDLNDYTYWYIKDKQHSEIWMRFNRGFFFLSAHVEKYYISTHKIISIWLLRLITFQYLFQAWKIWF